MREPQYTLVFVAGVIALIFALYGCYWWAKTFSYWLFYEDMVRETVIEMVKKDALL